MKYALVFALVSALIGSPVWAAKLSIDPLDEKDFDTPTCSIESAVKNKKRTTYNFWFAAPYGAKALVKIDGKLIELELAPSALDLWSFQKQDQVVATRYMNGDVTVDIRGKVSDACEANEEGCEYTQLSIERLTVTKGSDSVTLKKLSGGCGV